MRSVERQPLRAVPPLIGGMTGGLIGKQVDGRVVTDRVFEQVDDVAVKGDRRRPAFLLERFGHGESLVRIVDDGAHPALVVARLDPGTVDLGDDAHAAGDIHRLALGPAHPAESGGDEQAAGQVFFMRQSKLQPAGVQDGAVGSVHDPLGADIHPAAGRHLAVIGHAESRGAAQFSVLSKAPTIRALVMITRGAVPDDANRPRG